MTDKKRTSEDVIREVIHGAFEELTMAGYDYINEEGYERMIKRLPWYVVQEVSMLDAEDELLLLQHDAESMLEEALDMNDLDTVITMAEINLSDLIKRVAPHELDHNQMREIINFADELKTYLPTRG